MNQTLTESEIEKVVERLNYANQTDSMAQKLFFDQTEVIRQQGLNNERIVESLKNIASSSPNASARNEASKTLTYLNYQGKYQGKGKLLQTDSEAVKIGIVIGCIPILILLVAGLISDGNLGFGMYIVVLSGALFGFPGGIIGALMGKQRKYTKSASIVGGILGTILGIVVWQLLFLLLFGGGGGIY